MFEKSCRDLSLSTILLSSCLVSQNAFSNDYSYGSFEESLSGCFENMNRYLCDIEIKKRNDRALNYFTTFIAYKAAEKSLDHYGLLPGVKSLIHKIDDLRTFETSHGTYFFNGDSLRVKDLGGIQDSYFDVKLDFSSDMDLEEIKIRYSIRF